jgi:hypothetical protein
MKHVSSIKLKPFLLIMNVFLGDNSATIEISEWSGGYKIMGQ